MRICRNKRCGQPIPDNRRFCRQHFEFNRFISTTIVIAAVVTLSSPAVMRWPF